jgi:hypothetical protein
MKVFFCFFIILFLTSGCMLSFDTKHGSTMTQEGVKEGDSIDVVRKALGQESIMSNDGIALYYITSDSSHPYFLRPRVTNYNIERIDFKDTKVLSISYFKYNSVYDQKFNKKLKSQDKIKAADFFKEAFSSSVITPGG